MRALALRCVFAASLGCVLPTAAALTNVLVVGATPPTVLPAFDTIGMNLPYAGDDNTNGAVRIAYRPQGGEWREGHPGLRVEAYYRDEPVERREFAARLFDLDAGADYDVRATFADPDGVEGETVRVFRVATRPEPVVSNFAGRVWHVAPGAPAGGTGSADAPFAALADAVAKVAAGETILLHDGEHLLTNRHPLVLKASGTPEAPIVVRAAPGARPVLRGPLTGLEAPGSAAWRSEAPALPGVHSAALADAPAQVYWEAHYLGRCDNPTNLAAGRSSRHGKLLDIGLRGGWHWSGGRLFVKIPATWNEWSGPAENPGARGVHTVKRNYWGLMPKGRHIVLDGLAFRYFEQPIYLQVAADGEGDGLVVRNCRFEHFANGLHAYQTFGPKVTSAFRNVLIDRCEFSTSPSYWLRDWTLGHDVYSTQSILVSGIAAEEKSTP